MKINSVVVGIQYHEGVKSLNKGDTVELSFNGADDEFPTGIRVLNNDGVVVGNIIANMNHPSLNDDIIVSNNIKNNNAIRKVTTNNCKAVVVGIKRYVVFITINTTILVNNNENNNGDDNMDKIKELEARIEENKAQSRALRKERIEMKRELRALKKQQLEANEVVEETTEVEEVVVEEKGETMEEKLVKINKETIIQSVMERNIQPMAIELMQNGLTEAFDKAKEEYPIEVMAYTTKYIDLHPVANILLTIRSIDDIIAKRYLKGEVSGGEFDHMRAWIGIHSYFYYEHIIEEVSMEEFFTEASIKASEKFLKEEEEREYRNNDEDGGDDTTSSPNIEFVSWTQQSYAWCGSDVTIKVNGKEITLSRPLMSGGSVWFDDNWSEHVEDGPWSIREDALPKELKPYIDEITEVINNSIPYGCCGGCV